MVWFDLESTGSVALAGAETATWRAKARLTAERRQTDERSRRRAAIDVM